MINDEMIEKAVDWWANAIQSPKYDNGDSSPAGGVGLMLATMLGNSASKKVGESEISKFKEELGKAIRRVDRIDFYCDYGPTGILTEAMDKAGIPRSLAPWKTTMVVGMESHLRRFK